MPTPKCKKDMLGILLSMVAGLIQRVDTSTTVGKWTALTLTIVLVLLLALELPAELSVLVL